MNKLKNYIPIMSVKQGELKAFKELSAQALENITPLFDIHRIPIVGGKQKKTIDEHIEKIIINFEKNCEKKLFILDYSLMDLNIRMADNTHPFKYLCDTLNERSMNFIPCIGLDRDQQYLEVIKEVLLQIPDKKLCMRLLIDDLDSLEETQEEIYRILSYLKIEVNQCDLLIDFKRVEESQIEPIVDSLSELNQVIFFESWRSFIIAASSFPVSMIGISPDSQRSVRRVEYDLWRAIIQAAPLVGRKPKFGDYCIVDPERAEVDVVTMRASGKIRYTTTYTWEIFRGHSLLKGEKYQQYNSLSEKIIKSECFLGENYSWGDGYILQCANKIAKSGNLTTWIGVDTNHHITLVGEQIANYDDSLSID